MASIPITLSAEIDGTIVPVNLTIDYPDGQSFGAYKALQEFGKPEHFDSFINSLGEHFLQNPDASMIGFILRDKDTE